MIVREECICWEPNSELVWSLCLQLRRNLWDAKYWVNTRIKYSIITVSMCLKPFMLSGWFNIIFLSWYSKITVRQVSLKRVKTPLSYSWKEVRSQRKSFVSFFYFWKRLIPTYARQCLDWLNLFGSISTKYNLCWRYSKQFEVYSSTTMSFSTSLRVYPVIQRRLSWKIL